MSRFGEANDRAAHWLAAREEPGWNAQDEAALAAWLAEADGNKAAYWRLRHAWREADRIGALGSPTLARAVPDRSARRLPSRRLVLGGAIAASIVAVLFGVLVMGGGGMEPKVATQSYATVTGGSRVLDLADGSRVQLNTESRIRVAVSDRGREVWLDEGEAYFEVAKHEGRKFVIHAGSRDITVLGTKFSVRRKGTTVIVRVLEGRVRVHDTAGDVPARSSTISAGDVAMAQDTATLVVTQGSASVEGQLAWRSGMLNLDNAKLSDVAEDFNRYNRRHIIVLDSAAGALRIGGIFPVSQPDAFARLLHDAYGLKVEETPEALKISS
ncbi:MAG: FecR domain-containing protein [Nocardioides sp.]